MNFTVENPAKDFMFIEACCYTKELQVNDNCFTNQLPHLQLAAFSPPKSCIYRPRVILCTVTVHSALFEIRAHSLIKGWLLLSLPTSILKMQATRHSSGPR